MTIPSTLRAQPDRRCVSKADATALRAILQEHRRARADQIEALLWLYDDAAADPVDARELVVARAVLADVDAALQRIEDGSYGWCVRCCEPIGVERLYAAPRTLLCIGCAFER